MSVTYVMFDETQCHIPPKNNAVLRAAALSSVLFKTLSGASGLSVSFFFDAMICTCEMEEKLEDD